MVLPCHQHEIAESLAGGQPVLRGQDLIHDLVRLQISLQSHGRRETETAIERAADLGGETQGQTPVIGDQDAFQNKAVIETRQKFSCSIVGREDADVMKTPDAGRRPELGALGLRQIGQLLDVGDPAAVQPSKNLGRSVGGPAEADDEVFHASLIESQEVAGRSRRRHNKRGVGLRHRMSVTHAKIR